METTTTTTKSGSQTDVDTTQASPPTTTTTTADNVSEPVQPAATIAIGSIVNGTAPSVATIAQPIYRQLPDEDVDWRNKNNTASSTSVNAIMGKPNGSADAGDVDDGADERMLKDEVKPSIVPSKEATEVQFKSENGDTKINIGAVKQCLSGMSKQELMKYANDPFWIKLRWFLFLMFWLLWAAMLAGAIAIVVMAPKCAPPAPKKWWEESPIVRLSQSYDGAANNLKGLEDVLNKLEEQRVRAISLGSILKEVQPGHTVNFTDLNQQVGLVEDFKKFIKTATDKKINVILEIDPNHSSDQHNWFQKSIKKEEPYTSYYVWANGTKDKDSSKLLPPNNWQSVNGGSAWFLNEERQQFYLHQFNVSQPDFNYSNPAVVDAFSDVLKYWLNLGVKGFVLSNTRFLVENPSLRNDTEGPEYPAKSGTYSSLLHFESMDNPQNAIVLGKWRDIVKNYTGGEGLFTLSEGLTHEMLPLYIKEKTIIDVPQSLTLLPQIYPSNTSDNLNKSFSEVLAFAHWPGIDLNGKGPSLRKRMNADYADSLILMTMLLPATPILSVDDVLSVKKPFATLAEARTKLAFHYGETKTYLLNNGTVFAYTRIKSGNPGYLVAFNAAPQNTTINVTGISQMPEEVNIVAYGNSQHEKLENKKFLSNSIPISSKSTLVVTFVPI